VDESPAVIIAMIVMIVGPAMVVVRPVVVLTAVIAITPFNKASSATLSHDAAVPTANVHAAISVQPVMDLHFAAGVMHGCQSPIGTPGEIAGLAFELFVVLWERS